jgi:hypothetical protein
MAKTAVEIPKPRLNAEKRDKLMERLTKQLLNGTGDMASHHDVIETYVQKVYMGRRPDYWSDGYYDWTDQADNLEVALHDQVGLKVAQTAARLLRERIQKNKTNGAQASTGRR